MEGHDVKGHFLKIVCEIILGRKSSRGTYGLELSESKRIVLD